MPPAHRLTTGGADGDLDALLSAALDTHNHAAAGAVPSELSVRVESQDGGLVAGLSGWTWGTRAGWAMVWVREGDRGAGWGGLMRCCWRREGARWWSTMSAATSGAMR